MRRNLLSLFALALGALLVTSGLTACESTGNTGDNTGDNNTGDDTKDDNTGDDTKDDNNTGDEEENNSSEPAGDGSLGSACSEASDCDSGLKCETGEFLPGGICTEECAKDEDCGGDNKCVGNLCMAACDKEDATSCGRSDWGCNFLGFCEANGEAARNKSCAINGCASGLACSPDGLCTTTCSTDGDCEDGEFCRDFADWGVKYCAFECSTTTNKDCGDDTDLEDPNAAATGLDCRLGLTRPRCQAIGTLAEGDNCLPGKGYCEPGLDCKGKDGLDYPVCTERTSAP